MSSLSRTLAARALAGAKPLAVTEAQARSDRRVAAPLTAAMLLVLLLGAFLVYALFVQSEAFSEWYAVKPGILVNMAEDTGKLQIQPFPQASAWYQESANLHSERWAETLLFLGLRYATGMDMRDLSVAPFGIVLCLIALLFVFYSAVDTNDWQIGFLLTSLIFLFTWPMLSWVFHSGGWPATVMTLLSLGLVLRTSRGSTRHQVLLKAIALLLLFMSFNYYHAMAVLLTFTIPVLFAYQAVAYGFARWRGRFAPAPIASHSNLAAICVILFFLDPLFTLLIGQTGVTRPWEGIANFYSSIFITRGDVVPDQVGYSLLGRVLLMLPLVVLLLAGTWLFARTHVARLMDGRSPSQRQIVCGALYLAVPFVLFGAVAAGTGSFRYPEAYFLLLLAVPLMLFQRLSLLRQLTRGAAGEGAAIGLTLVVVAFASFFVLAREPISRWVHVNDSDRSVASWAANHVSTPYFADNFTTGLILLENYSSPIVPLQGAVADVEAAVYNGPDRFAQELRSRGAGLAVLNGRSIASAPAEDEFKTLKTTDFFIPPIPRYDFGGPPYGRVYDDGTDSVITLGPPP